MKSYSDAIDKQLSNIGYSGSGLVQTMGKHWVLYPGISTTKACNYGWHFKGSTSVAYAPATSWTGSGTRVWQPPGTAHNPQHEDYSQTCTLIRQNIKIGGKHYRLADVLSDKELSKFVSSVGAVPSRQPGVPVLDPIPSSSDTSSTEHVASEDISSVPPSSVPTSPVDPVIPPEALPTNPNETSENSDVKKDSKLPIGKLLLITIAIAMSSVANHFSSCFDGPK